MTVVASVILAEVLLAMGDLVEAEGIVRTGLAATGCANGEAADPAPSRGAGGASGRERGGARSPGTRARDQPHLEERPECEAGAPMAEMLLAQNDAAAAFELIERVLP